MGKDWHGLTAIVGGTASERSLSPQPDPGPNATFRFTARLCQQAASWDDRTQSPRPLHLAPRSDLDHPQRAELPEEADDS
ncbi:RNaseH domain-containing protein [Nocardia sp. NPDC050413]|uniref:RNaseH domain-containing protein n=1 Tax=Nocardia sp. NPDC050413 TaxID=3155784 RepID=UPI0033F1BB4D